VDQGISGSATSARSGSDSGKKEPKFRTPKVKLPPRSSFAHVPSGAESAGGSGDGSGATTDDNGGSSST
jgi:hypothetical protein